MSLRDQRIRELVKKEMELNRELSSEEVQELFQVKPKGATRYMNEAKRMKEQMSKEGAKPKSLVLNPPVKKRNFIANKEGMQEEIELVTKGAVADIWRFV